MFLPHMKQTLLIVFYLTVTYTLSLRLLGGLTYKAQWEKQTYNRISKKTLLLIVLAYLNLMGIPPLPIFWAKAATLAVILPKITETQLLIIVIYTNIAILLYAILWARALRESGPKTVSSSAANYCLTETMSLLVALQVLAPLWLVVFL